MMTDSFMQLREQHLMKRWHNIKYKKETNNSFHKFLYENPFDKFRVFRDETREWVTYYFSKEQKLKARFYDYEAAMMVYIKYPTRNFIRRKPCKQLDPECNKCPEFLADPVTDYLEFFSADLRADFYDFWFRQMGDIHGLLVAYTIEKEFEFRYSCEVSMPEYFCIDYNSDYFKQGLSTKSLWENLIYTRRINSDKEFYSLTHNIGVSKGRLGCNYGSPSLTIYTSSLLPEYFRIVKEAPLDPEKYKTVGSDFEMLAWFDMKDFSSRNSWHKWIYNTWVENLSFGAGWFCAWSGSDSLNGNPSDALNAYPGFGDMANQLGSNVGWELDTSGGNTDTVYHLTTDMIYGYQYSQAREPRPDR